ncbi:MAG: hypothetical protein MI755_00495 [Sphingomonadales bacterium]|nr:hypothetical protein [Sphingomonadales bacterium]
MAKTILLIIVLGAALIGVSLFAIDRWQSLADVEISTAGTIALALGLILTFGLGVALMALVFYSSRKGYDDAASRSDLQDDD